MTRRASRSKMSDKRRTMLTKRKYKVRVIAQPIPTTPSPTAPVNSTAPNPTVATVSTQMFMVKSAATSILVTVYNLAKGKFTKIPYPRGRPQTEGNPFLQNSNPPHFEDIPNAPVR